MSYNNVDLPDFSKLLSNIGLNQDKDALLENEVVKDILDSFGGKIIDDSIKKVSS